VPHDILEDPGECRARPRARRAQHDAGRFRGVHATLVRRVRPLPILHEDDRIVIVDKPAGVLSVPGASEEPCVPSSMAARGLRVWSVHRLDREVSGALILARDREASEALQDLFRARQVQKIYWGMISGALEPRQGELHAPILDDGGQVRVSARGKPARTRYSTLECHPGASELELELVTGRKNQLRVHLAHAGHPLVGERKYARGRDSVLPLRSRRVALHAWRLALVLPWNGKKLGIEAPLPDDLSRLRERARRGAGS
jgi:RluA family pseudouridine synthase